MRPPCPPPAARPPRDRSDIAVEGELDVLEPLDSRQFHVAIKRLADSLSFGSDRSPFLGSGLEYVQSRPYLPGDDIRAMDWRVTARTGKPHVRVYTEEKDRPALLVVDQRINMFFGTRRAMKSVTAGEAAALAAWRALDQGDRVGGFGFNDSPIEQVRPHRSRAAVMRLLEKVAEQNAALKADAPAGNPAQLDAVLEAVARTAKHDYLVLIASDFDGHSPRTRELLLGLAQ